MKTKYVAWTGLIALGAAAVALATIAVAAGRSRTTSASAAPAPAPRSQEPAETPAGMVWIPGGEFSMGSEEPAFRDARPIHRVRVDGFWMDATEVTNAQFAKFVEATGYVTIAERTPKAEDFPGAPPENLVAGSIVFTPPAGPVPLDTHFHWWSYVKGANWRHPEGPASDLKGRENYPVVHVALGRRAGLREVGGQAPADRGRVGVRRPRRARPQALRLGRRVPARRQVHGNIFQGHFPDKNTAARTASPASPRSARSRPTATASTTWPATCGSGAPTGTAPTTIGRLAAEGGVARNPPGPPDSLDPAEPGVAEAGQKGGSFLCTDQYCTRYMPGGRGKGEPGHRHQSPRLPLRPGRSGTGVRPSSTLISGKAGPRARPPLIARVYGPAGAGVASAAPSRTRCRPGTTGRRSSAIVTFVSRVTNQAAADGGWVKPEDRVAVFDNDGTLWCEQPLYFQFAVRASTASRRWPPSTRSGRTRSRSSRCSTAT